MTVEFFSGTALFSVMIAIGTFGAYLALSNQLLSGESGRTSAWTDIRSTMQIACRNKRIQPLKTNSGSATNYSVIGGGLDEHERVSFRILVEVDDHVANARRRITSVGDKARFGLLCALTAILLGGALNWPIALGRPPIFPSLVVATGVTLTVSAAISAIVVGMVYNRRHIEDWNYVKDKSAASKYIIDNVRK